MRGLRLHRDPLGEMIPLAITLSIAIVLLGCGSESHLYEGPTDIALLKISDGPIFDYGSVEIGQTKDHEFTITNTGKNPATAMTSAFYLSLNFTFKGGEYPGEDGTCEDSLEVGEACNIVVRFSPKYTGSFEGIVRISYFNGYEEETTTHPILKGRGIGEVESD